MTEAALAIIVPLTIAIRSPGIFCARLVVTAAQLH